MQNTQTNGMTFEEAVKEVLNGKEVKRPKWKISEVMRMNDNYFKTPTFIDRDDLLANDYVISNNLFELSENMKRLGFEKIGQERNLYKIFDTALEVYLIYDSLKAHYYDSRDASRKLADIDITDNIESACNELFSICEHKFNKKKK